MSIEDQERNDISVRQSLYGIIYTISVVAFMASVIGVFIQAYSIAKPSGYLSEAWFFFKAMTVVILGSGVVYCVISWGTDMIEEMLPGPKQLFAFNRPLAFYWVAVVLFTLGRPLWAWAFSP